MDYKRKILDKLISDELNGCIQIEETFDVDSLEGASTAIFLDGIRQNRAIAASASLGIVDRYKLKDSLKDGQFTISNDDLEFDTTNNRLVIERVCGDVQILCCSSSMLKLFKTINQINFKENDIKK